VALGLYVHVPFCAAICNYCNFNRGLFDEPLKRQYVAALLADIRRAGDGSPADTIFFGGGTPSLLEPEDVYAIVTACRDAFAIGPGAEVTLEANPESVTRPRLEAYLAAGITRVSFGVQSFRDEELARLSRLHSASRAAEAVAEARAAGVDNVSLDLMMWLPGQSVSHWLESIDRLVSLAPDHASLYLLEVYPNAPLKDDMARARWSLAPDDDAAEMYLQGLDRLDAAGYEQYEISNVARPGRASRHNLKYWSDGEWLGFGCGAHSTRGGVRWKNRAATSDYMAAVAGGHSLVAERRELSRDERIEEAMFTGLRLAGGVDVAAMGARYDLDVWKIYGEALTPFAEAGLLIYDGARLRLTRQGMLLANEVMAVFIDFHVR
jgi:oxygen-independent coproporphyrinogen-3 oxidase